MNQHKQALHFALDAGREFIELNQLLKLVGLCDSGGAGKQLVAAAWCVSMAWWNCARPPKSAPGSGCKQVLSRSG